MPTYHPTLPTPPQPTRVLFDPFNSSSTGHQRAENRLSGSTGWRESRTYKLGHQLEDTSGRGGHRRLHDLVGAGSLTFGEDGRRGDGTWEKGALGLRERGCQDIRRAMPDVRKRHSEEIEAGEQILKKARSSPKQEACVNPAPPPSASRPTEHEAEGRGSLQDGDSRPTPIFCGLTMYVNGSTAPLVSDLRLKQMFVSHGGKASLAMARRTVTHVVLGKTGGGGLASGKIHKEVNTVRGRGVKYVTAQWVLDSVEKGIRQQEGHYVPPMITRRIGGSDQRSVRDIFSRQRTDSG